MNELPGLSHLLLSGGSFPGIGSFLTCMHYAAKSPGVTSEISEYSLSLSLSICLSLSLSPHSLSLQNSTIPLTSANSEISLLNLVRPPGSVWVSLPVLWPGTSSQAGRWDTYKDDLVYFSFWESLSYTSWYPVSNKHRLIYLNLFSSFLRRS